MKDFSVGDAYGAGFRLIGREPVVLLWWAAAYIVLALLPQGLILAAIWPMVMEMARSGAEGGSAQQMAALQGQAPLYNLIQIAASLVSTTVLLCAVFRAVLEPERRGFGYLRLGAQELWVGLVIVVLYVAMIVAIIVIAIPTAIVALAVHRPWATAVVILLACGVLGWLMIRFSLAAVVTFAQRRFALGDSWTLTEDRALKIFLVGLLLVLTVIAAELVLACMALVAMGGSFAALSVLERISGPAEVLARFWPVILMSALVFSVVGAAVFAVLAAPFAEIYREITDEGAAAAV